MRKSIFALLLPAVACISFRTSRLTSISNIHAPARSSRGIFCFTNPPQNHMDCGAFVKFAAHSTNSLRGLLHPGPVAKLLRCRLEILLFAESRISYWAHKKEIVLLLHSSPFGVSLAELYWKERIYGYWLTLIIILIIIMIMIRIVIKMTRNVVSPGHGWMLRKMPSSDAWCMKIFHSNRVKESCWHMCLLRKGRHGIWRSWINCQYDNWWYYRVVILAFLWYI